MWTNEELINICKEEVENTIKFQLASKRFKHLIRDFETSLVPNTYVNFSPDNIKWDENKKTEEKLNDYFSVHYYIPLSTTGKLKFHNNSTGAEKIIEHSFHFYVDMMFHFDQESPSFNFDISDESKKILRDYNYRIWDIIKAKHIYSLLDDEILFDNKNSILFFTDITRLEKNRSIPFQDFDSHDDLVICHQDIVFAIAELFAYKPYISDFTLNFVNVGSTQIFQYFPNFCDKRYLSTCGKIIELLYNYWDKIGDILAVYFTPQIPSNKIYFGTVIDSISSIYQSNEHFDWLKDFKKNSYEELNKKRKQIVHYTTVESQILRNYRENYSDFENLREKQEEKENFTSYFMTHYESTKKGFYHAMKLIELK